MIADKTAPVQGELGTTDNLPINRLELADAALQRIGSVAQTMAQAHFGQRIRAVVMLVHPVDDTTFVYIGSPLLRARTVEVLNACAQRLDPRPASLRGGAAADGDIYLKAVDD